LRSALCDDGLFDFKIAAGQRDVRVTVAPFGEPIELVEQAPGKFVSALRPDTFRLRLREARRPSSTGWSTARTCGPARQPSKTNV
jgi:hypothetical protein